MGEAGVREGVYTDMGKRAQRMKMLEMRKPGIGESVGLEELRLLASGIFYATEPFLPCKGESTVLG